MKRALSLALLLPSFAGAQVRAGEPHNFLRTQVGLSEAELLDMDAGKAIKLQWFGELHSCSLKREAFVEGSDFDEVEFFRAIEASGTRALLIGRRALVILGLPVLTADYDFWIHIDDSEAFNEAVEPFGLVPTRKPDEARRRGRYALENLEKVDVLVARVVPTVDGVEVLFEDLWLRRRSIALTPDVSVAVPSLEDLILTKRFGARPKDLEDIRLLEVLRSEEANDPGER